MTNQDRILKFFKRFDVLSGPEAIFAMLIVATVVIIILFAVRPPA